MRIKTEKHITIMKEPLGARICEYLFRLVKSIGESTLVRVLYCPITIYVVVYNKFRSLITRSVVIKLKIRTK
jgi:hypothetical protein